MLIRYGV